jgi:aerobic carbon-monoxide dehydrogenase large subunit
MEKGKIGQSVLRLEDNRLLRGEGRFTANQHYDGECHAIFVRSPYAHADVLGIDAEDAREMPGVRAVFTGADTAELKPIPTISPVTDANGNLNIEPPRRVLATDRVRHVGESVALVVADSLQHARQAAESVFVDYAERDAVTAEAIALEEGAPVVWDQAPGNLCYDWRAGDQAATSAAFDAAEYVVSLDYHGNRLHYAAIETRTAIAVPDDGGITLYCPSQGANLLQTIYAERVFGQPKSWLRVVTGDVGGGFGPKYFAYVEQAAIIFAATQLNCPVRWEQDRAESLVSDVQSRALTGRVDLAVDKDGKFLGVRFDNIANLGVYLSTFGPGIPTSGVSRAASGCYQIPNMDLRVRGVFTNTLPVDAFRGAGGPDPMTMLEAVVDLAATKSGIDRLEIRRRNMVPASAMPYTTPVQLIYESGDFEAVMDAAVDRADWNGFEARRSASKDQGLLRGIGLSAYVHCTGGITDENSVVAVKAEGYVSALAGGQSSGQGHETAFAQIVAEAFDVPYDEVRVQEGDTALIPKGGGTGGSSSTVISGATLARAAKRAADQGRELAAHVLEAATEDIEIRDGQFLIQGTDRAIGLYDLAARIADMDNLPPHLPSVIEGQSEFEDQKATMPQGAIVCEVEIDPATGFVRIDRVTSAADVGAEVNPALVAAQMHGGIAQGLGQAFQEDCLYDPDNGQLITGSWMDYSVPLADDFPMINHISVNTPSPHNHMGFKGVGELGTIGAPAAALNAVADALGPKSSLSTISMPWTAEKIWQTCRKPGQ